MSRDYHATEFIGRLAADPDTKRRDERDRENTLSCSREGGVERSQRTDAEARGTLPRHRVQRLGRGVWQLSGPRPEGIRKGQKQNSQL